MAEDHRRHTLSPETPSPWGPAQPTINQHCNNSRVHHSNYDYDLIIESCCLKSVGPFYRQVRWVHNLTPWSSVFSGFYSITHCYVEKPISASPALRLGVINSMGAQVAIIIIRLLKSTCQGQLGI